MLCGKKILIPLGGGLPKGFKYVTALSLTIDDEFVLTGELFDQNGDIVGEPQVIDLPLESMIINGSYDSVNKMLILTLQNGNTIEIPISALISGLVPDSRKIAGNPLSSDISSETLLSSLFTIAEV